MTHEAKLAPTDHGQLPADDGWFVVNMKDARWRRNERFGEWCSFEGDARFPQLGINVRILQPGQPACMYHREALQEAFLVLSGECTLVVEGEERSLKAWDFFHAPPGTHHVFVGAGDGPCAILMTGVRGDDHGVVYPVEPVAARHGASVAAETSDPRVAYEGTPPPTEIPSPWPIP